MVAEAAAESGSGYSGLAVSGNCGEADAVAAFAMAAVVQQRW